MSPRARMLSARKQFVRTYANGPERCITNTVGDRFELFLPDIGCLFLSANGKLKKFIRIRRQNPELVAKFVKLPYSAMVKIPLKFLYPHREPNHH